MDAGVKACNANGMGRSVFMGQRELLEECGEASVPGLRYGPEFLTATEEAALLAHIAALDLRQAQYKSYQAKRRIVSYGGRYDYDRNELLPSGVVPEFLHPLRARIAAWVSVAPEDFTHALIAEYAPGTPLGWHRDVPDFELIAGVSLAGPGHLRFRPYPPGHSRQILHLHVQPRSIYILRGAARWEWQHSVVPSPVLRYSITFRTLRAAGETTLPRPEPRDQPGAAPENFI